MKQFFSVLLISLLATGTLFAQNTAAQDLDSSQEPTSVETDKKVGHSEQKIVTKEVPNQVEKDVKLKDKALKSEDVDTVDKQKLIPEPENVSEPMTTPASSAVVAEEEEDFSSAPEDTDYDDTQAPKFEDFALAHQSLKAIPRVTAIVSDDMSGVKSVTMYVRSLGTNEYKTYLLEAGNGGLFIGRLQQGIQKSGFEYYVEAKDAVGNIALLGNAAHPYHIDPVELGLMDEISLEKKAQIKKGPPIASYWIAIAYGIGVLGLSASAVLAYQSLNTMFWVFPDTDVFGLREDSTFTDSALQSLKNGMILGASASAIAGVVGLSAFAVGTGLLIYDIGYE